MSRPIKVWTRRLTNVFSTNPSYNPYAFGCDYYVSPYQNISRRPLTEATPSAVDVNPTAFVSSDVAGLSAVCQI